MVSLQFLCKQASFERKTVWQLRSNQIPSRTKGFLFAPAVQTFYKRICVQTIHSVEKGVHEIENPTSSFELLLKAFIEVENFLFWGKRRWLGLIVKARNARIRHSIAKAAGYTKRAKIFRSWNILLDVEFLLIRNRTQTQHHAVVNCCFYFIHPFLYLTNIPGQILVNARFNEQAQTRVILQRQ